jgi:cob(I)alamin adenosyltransferase
MSRVEPLSSFILPGGCELAARLHVARTCCRRAERALVTLHRAEPVAQEIIVYLNRLGDLLFAWARQANREANRPDVPWVPENKPLI